jgi:general nucleoside transport system ATP-binding protein
VAYLALRGICKYYPEQDVVANDHVDLTVERNEIHAIVGENGAGKTTLMKILYGLERADSGQIVLNGEEVHIKNPLDANQLGIGMVHQHFKLIRSFTVAENVTLGIVPKRYAFFIDRREAVKRVADVISEYGFDLNPESKISELTPGEMQQVEIVKILYRRADILILDEPTSVLAEQQIKTLFDTLRKLTSLGKTVIIITHKLDEVMAISDRVTVMRKGMHTTAHNTSEVDQIELSRLMVGKGITFRFDREHTAPGETVLALHGVSIAEKGGHRPLLDDVSLRVREGEIIGIAGVAGNGLKELEEIVNGLRKVTAGGIEHRGLDVTNARTYFLREQGMAYVPADRLHRGSSLSSSVLENMIITTHHSFLKQGFIRRNMALAFGRDLSKSYSINADLDVPIGTLSGGNIQKVILSRELAVLTDFIMFSDPTWGLDVASANFIYEKILECRHNRAAILLISSDLDEILGLADSIAIMYRGRIVGMRKNDGALTKEGMGEYMLGLKDDFKGDVGNDGQATLG